MRKNRFVFIVLILVAFILLLITPYYLIRNNISLTNESLSSIGSYISGGISVLNLFVFVYLTMLIAKYEDVKSRNEIRTQKIILQSQLRQSELSKFVSNLEEAFDTSQPPGVEHSILRFSKAHLLVNSFITQNQFLFPLLKNPAIFDMGKNIALSFAEMVEQLEKNEAKINKTEFEKIFLKIIDQKNRFIHLLQAFIIDDLES